MPKTVELIAVGTELLLGQIVNTNAQYLSQQLAELGLDVYYQSVVGDNSERIRTLLSTALCRSDIVILCGGLGPTEDDLTREAVAEHFSLPLVLSQEALAVLEAQFAGRPMPKSNFRQAHVPAGAKIMPNPRGTAPGLWVELEGKLIFLLPGPPRELQLMFKEQVVPVLQERNLLAPGLFSRTIRFSGIGESALAEVLEDLIATQTDPTIAVYSRLGEVDVRLTTRALDQPEGIRKTLAVQSEIENRLSAYVYGYDGDTLASSLGDALLSRGLTLALAESCSGGLAGHMITNQSGSSAYFLGGVVCYDNGAKRSFLGVSEATLRDYGAVSEQCAKEMLIGAVNGFGASVGIAITGIAGPQGGTDLKPVGTVCIAVGDNDPVVTRLQLRGDREAIKERAVKEALRRLLIWLRENR